MNIVSIFSLVNADSSLNRLFIVVPLFVGFVTASLGFVLYYEALWALALSLFFFGRIIEGTVVVRGFRKVIHYIRVALNYISTSSYGSTSSKSMIDKIRLRILFSAFSVILTIAVVIGVLFAGFLFGHTLSVKTLAYVWAIFAAASAGSTLIFDFRDIIDQTDTYLILASTLCIIGAEVFRYPSEEFPVAWLVPFLNERTIVAVSSVIPGVSAWNVVAYIFGQFAFISGVFLAVVFLFSSNSRSSSTRINRPRH